MGSTLRLVDVSPRQVVCELEHMDALGIAMDPRWRMEDAFVTVSRNATGTAGADWGHRVTVTRRDGSVRLDRDTRAIAPQYLDDVMRTVNEVEQLMMSEGLSIESRSMDPFVSLDAYRYHGWREGDGYGVTATDPLGGRVTVGRYLGAEPYEALLEACERLGVEALPDTFGLRDARRGENREHWEVLVRDRRPVIAERLAERKRSSGPRAGEGDWYVCGWRHSEVVKWLEERGLDVTTELIERFERVLADTFDASRHEQVDLGLVLDEAVGTGGFGHGHRQARGTGQEGDADRHVVCEGIHTDFWPCVTFPKDLPEQVSQSAASALLWHLVGRACDPMEGGTRKNEDGRWEGTLAYRERESGLGYALAYEFTEGDTFATVTYATLAPAPTWDLAREGREVGPGDVIALWPDDIAEWLGLGKGDLDNLGLEARMAAEELFERLTATDRHGTTRYVGYDNDQVTRMVAECRPLVFDAEGKPRMAVSRDAAMHQDMAVERTSRGRKGP